MRTLLGLFLFLTFSKTWNGEPTCSRCNKDIAVKHLFVFLTWRAVGLRQVREEGKRFCMLGGQTGAKRGSPSCERKLTLNKPIYLPKDTNPKLNESHFLPLTPSQVNAFYWLSCSEIRIFFFYSGTRRNGLSFTVYALVPLQGTLPTWHGQGIPVYLPCVVPLFHYKYKT